MLQAANLGEVSRCLWPLCSPGSYNFTIGFFELVQDLFVDWCGSSVLDLVFAAGWKNQ